LQSLGDFDLCFESLLVVLERPIAR
jgi:hypothetical protein